MHWDSFVDSAPEYLLAAIKSLPGTALLERADLIAAANYLQHLATDRDFTAFELDASPAPDLETRGGAIHAFHLPTPARANADIQTRLFAVSARAAEALKKQNHVGALEFITEAQSILKQASEADRRAIRMTLPHLQAQWARTLDLSDAPGALAQYESAYLLAKRTNQPFATQRAASQLAWAHAERGRSHSAQRWLVKAHHEPAARNRFTAINALTQALISVDQNERSTAGQHLSGTAELTSSEYWAALLWVRALHLRSQAGAIFLEEQLCKELERYPGVIDSPGANGRYVRMTRDRLSTIRGRIVTQITAPILYSSADNVIAARTELWARDFHNAITYSRPAANPSQEPRTRASALIIIAAASLALGRRQSALSTFAQAHTLIDREQLYSSYDNVPIADLQRLSGESGLGIHHALDALHRDQQMLPELSCREREVLSLLLTGRPLAEIAHALFISPNTLKTTLQRLYRKLQVNSRHAAEDIAQLAGFE